MLDEFAAELGINARTLTYWKWVLGKDARGECEHGPSASAPFSAEEPVKEFAAKTTRLIEVQGASDGSGFVSTSKWDSNFSDANGWNLPRYCSTIAFPDINGGGAADLCGRGSSGILCGLSNGTNAFTGISLWNSSFSDANGWNAVDKYSTIRFPDVNGEHWADVCGRGIGGIICARANGGNGFTREAVWKFRFQRCKRVDRREVLLNNRLPRC